MIIRLCTPIYTYSPLISGKLNDYKKFWRFHQIPPNPLTTNVPYHIETLWKSLDWFLYNGEHWLLMG